MIVTRITMDIQLPQIFSLIKKLNHLIAFHPWAPLQEMALINNPIGEISLIFSKIFCAQEFVEILVGDSVIAPITWTF